MSMLPHSAAAVVAVTAAAVAAAAAVPGRPGRLGRPGGPGSAESPTRPPASATDRGPEQPWRTRAAATAGTALGVAVLLGGAVGLVAGALTGIACWRATARLEPPQQRRRRERLAAGVPHVVDLMAACLACGLSPASALERITDAVDAPVSEELAEVSARLRLGADPAGVWRELARHPQLGPLGRSLARATESGASVADALQRLAEDQRRDRRAAVEVRARAVGVRAAVPLGLCLLPAFVLVGVVPLLAGSLSLLTGR